MRRASSLAAAPSRHGPCERRSPRGGPRSAASALLIFLACGPPPADADDARAPAAAPAADAQPPAARATRTVALTFDDAPGVFLDTALSAARAANERLLAALAAEDVHATAFVNEGKLDGEGRVAILRRWVEEGHDLGNHTFGHPDLHGTPLEEFQRDVLRGEGVTRELLAGVGGEPRFFRHPFLHTGRSLAVRDSLEAFLDARGYRVAPVTIDNYEYVFARAYDRALLRADSAGAERTAEAYLAYMDTVFGYYEAQSRAHFGREPAQVLLLHVNRLNADVMPELLAAIERRGYAVVPLESALEDPLYGSEDTFTGGGGITWLHRWALTAGARGAAFAGEPEVPGWVERAAAGR